MQFCISVNIWIGIQETVLLYKNYRGRRRVRYVLTEMDTVQEELYKLFDLDSYPSKK